MWLKIKNSFIFGHLDTFWVIFTCVKNLENVQPCPVKNDHFIGSTRESLDIWRPYIHFPVSTEHLKSEFSVHSYTFYNLKMAITP